VGSICHRRASQCWIGSNFGRRRAGTNRSVYRSLFRLIMNLVVGWIDSIAVVCGMMRSQWAFYRIHLSRQIILPPQELINCCAIAMFFVQHGLFLLFVTSSSALFWNINLVCQEPLFYDILCNTRSSDFHCLRYPCVKTKGTRKSRILVVSSSHS